MACEQWRVDADEMLESGTGSISGIRPRMREAGQPLRIVWSGIHIGRKALPIVLHALAELRRDAGPSKRSDAATRCDAAKPPLAASQLGEAQLLAAGWWPQPICDAASGGIPPISRNDGRPDVPPIQLTVLGDGPESGRWRRLADELGVSSQLSWTGNLPRKDALLAVGRADAMAFTSVQEGTPHAVLEALSLGLPVICHDACGMGAAVTEECGVKVPMHSPQASIAGFAAALRRLRDSPGELTRLSAGALRRATELGWAAKGLRIALAYDQILSLATGGAHELL